MDKRELRKELSKLRKEQNEKIFDLKREFEHMRERICIAYGGHFYGESYVVNDPRILDPYRTAYCKSCEVCNKKIYIEEEKNEG